MTMGNIDCVAPNLDVITYNVNGLKNYHKSKRIINKFIKMSKPITRTVICLQETHLTHSEVRAFSNKWRFGNAHSTLAGRVGDVSKRGVSVLWFEHQWDSYVDSSSDSDGRIVSVTLSLHNQLYSFVSVYSPVITSPDSVEFVFKLEEFITNIVASHPGTRLIVAGDFNHTLNSNDYTTRQVNPKETTIRTHFNCFVKSFGLVDTYRSLHTQGGYTWGFKNKVRMAGVSRLDRIYTSNENLKVISSSVSPDYDESDHAMLKTRLYVPDLQPHGPGYFKMCPTLLTFQPNILKLKSVITDAIASSEYFSNLNMRWDFVKCMIRSEVMNLQNKANKSLQSDLESNENELNQLHLRSLNTNLDLFTKKLVKSEIRRLTAIVQGLRQKESELIILKSRAKWSEEGERSNKYFLNLVKARTSKARINKLIVNGSTINDNESIIENVHHYYSELYSRNNNIQQSRDGESEFLSNLPQLTPDQKQLMDSPLTVADLHNSLKSMSDSTPGPDGLPYSVYKHFSDLLLPLLLKSWQYSLANGSLSDEMRLSYITLLPKPGKDPSYINNLRPISLSNADLKIITKALTQKINTVLPTIIHYTQTGYIPGRQVHDNLSMIDYAQSILKSNKQQAYLVSLDARKAFDSVDHKYISRSLKAYGFGDAFINAVMILYSNLQASVLINGFKTEMFKLEVGVKQGDALSCALFVICIDPLIRYIHNCDLVNGIKIRSPFSLAEKELKLFGYADDINPIVRDHASVRQVLQIYSKFSQISGICLNIDKTEVAILNSQQKDNPLNHVEQIEIDNNLVLHTTNSVKICGIYFPLDLDNSYEHNIVQKIHQLQVQLNLWKQRQLSIEGKVLLVKTFGISQLTHSLQTCHIKPQDLKRVEQIIFNFIWNSKQDKIKRNYMYLPKGEGGLAVTDIKSYFNALKVKRFLRYHNQDHMASTLLDDILFKAGFRSPLVYSTSKKLTQNIANMSIKIAVENISFLNDKTTHLFSKTESATFDKSRHLIINAIAHYPLFNSPIIQNLPHANDVIYRLSRLGIYSISTLINHKQEHPDCDPCMAVATAYKQIPPAWKTAYNNNLHLVEQHKEHKMWFSTIDNKFIIFSNKSNLSILLTKWHRQLLPLDNDWLKAKHGILSNYQIDMPSQAFKIPRYYTPYQRSFQLKILHKSLTTKSKLYKYKIYTEEEAICTHCHESVDDLYHGLILCPGSKRTWNSLQTLLDIRGIKVKLNIGHVVFGVPYHNHLHEPLNIVITKLKLKLLHNSESRRFLTLKNIQEIITQEFDVQKAKVAMFNSSKNIHLLKWSALTD